MLLDHFCDDHEVGAINSTMAHTLRELNEILAILASLTLDDCRYLDEARSDGTRSLRAVDARIRSVRRDASVVVQERERGRPDDREGTKRGG